MQIRKRKVGDQRLSNVLPQIFDSKLDELFHFLFYFSFCFCLGGKSWVMQRVLHPPTTSWDPFAGDARNWTGGLKHANCVLSTGLNRLLVVKCSWTMLKAFQLPSCSAMCPPKYSRVEPKICSKGSGLGSEIPCQVQLIQFLYIESDNHPVVIYWKPGSISLRFLNPVAYDPLLRSWNCQESNSWPLMHRPCALRLMYTPPPSI